MDKEPPVHGIKKCPKCEQLKPVLAFAANRRSPDGLNYYCRECKALEQGPRDARRLAARRMYNAEMRRTGDT